MGVRELPEPAQKVVQKYILIQTLTTFIQSLGFVIFTLFLLDQVGFIQTGILFSFLLASQLIFDYPSGALGDWIGQRWVLALANASFSLGLIILTFAQSFTDFIIPLLIIGFAQAQFSGAIDTWLDNNYQQAIENLDTERKIYGFMRSRSRTVTWAANSLSFVIGSTLSTITSRTFVFQVQAILLIFLLLITIIVLRDVNSNITSQPEDTNEGYFKILKGGISYFLTNKPVFFIIIAQVINSIGAGLIFFLLVLFPILFGYTGSDGLAGVFQGLYNFVLMITGLFVANFSKRLKNHALPYFKLIYAIFYFGGISIVLILVPPTIPATINILGIILILFLMLAIDGIFDETANVLTNRVMIDLIPPAYRNGIYSLTPTLVALLGIFILPIAGFVIEETGLVGGLWMIVIFGLLASVSYFLAFRTQPKNAVNLENEAKITNIS